MRLSILLLTTLPMLSAHAGGLYLNEFMTKAQGAAGAGSAALAEDASTALHNPAGMTRLSGRHLSVGAGFLSSDVQFSADSDTPVPGSDGGQQGGVTPIGSAFYTHQLSERWVLGLGFYSIAGAALDPNNSWAGRFQVTEIELLTATGGVALAYRINDWLSLGATAGLVYSTLDFDLASPGLGPIDEGRINLDGDDLTWSGSIGLLAELSPRTRLGLLYYTGFEVNFDGDLTLDRVGTQRPVDTAFDLAPMIRLSVYHELNDRLTLLGSAGWEGWSELDDLVITGADNSASLKRDWDDTWHLALGLRYQVNEALMLQTGVAYDSSPTRAKDRTADTPIDRQWRFAVGGEYALRDDLALGASVIYADYGKGAIDNRTLSGSYDDNDLLFFGAHLNWQLD